ncbi:MAG: hypothetical protein HFG47_07515 [Lachnospiraceae bacterium]|nr:hypothetical protein [Lachnospiraceae bacterium]
MNLQSKHDEFAKQALKQNKHAKKEKGCRKTAFPRLAIYGQIRPGDTHSAIHCADKAALQHPL